MLSTGCRPKEAAYIIQHKSIKPNDFLVERMSHKLQAFAPSTDTKTKKDYLWLLPDQHETVYQRILNRKDTGFQTY